MQLSADETFLTVRWPDGAHSRYALQWLRDNDPAGFHPDTQERIFDLLSVPDDLALAEAEAEGETIRLRWTDGAETRLARDWLRAAGSGKRLSTLPPVLPESWDGDFAARLPRHAGPAVLHDDEALTAWLTDLARWGIAVLEDVPCEAGALETVCRRIAHLRETNFGLTFEVRSQPQPINLAYTPMALPLHTDLPNQELPPGFQFLHTLVNSATGGESLLADGLRMAEAIRTQAPEHYRALRDVAIPFRFHDGGHDIRYRRPVIREDERGEPVEINWNAHLADSFDMEPEVTAAYYPAYRAFMALTRDPAYRIALKTRPGELVGFNNRRTLHGRSAFDPTSGSRHLRGCYLDWTDLISRLRVLMGNAKASC